MRSVGASFREALPSRHYVYSPNINDEARASSKTSRRPNESNVPLNSPTTPAIGRMPIRPQVGDHRQ
jgi:hypothetical protein